MAEDLPDGARALLEAPNFAHVATLREDGTVHGVVVWTHVEGDRVALNTAEGRAWRKNVARDPRVTISVHDQDNPYTYVSVTGRVVEDTHEGADAHIDALAKKYMGVDEYPLRQPGEQRVRLLVEPEKVTHFTPPS